MLRNQRARNRKWWKKALVYTAAALAGGAAAGALLGVIGSAVASDTRWFIASALSIVALIFGALGLFTKAPVLQCDRETPQRWVDQGAFHWATRNGAALGCGAMTRIGFWLWYVVPLGALLIGDPLRSAVVYGAYGLCRGGSAWLLIGAGAVLRRREGAGFPAVASWLLARRPVADRIAAALLVFVGGLVVTMRP